MPNVNDTRTITYNHNDLRQLIVRDISEHTGDDVDPDDIAFQTDEQGNVIISVEYTTNGHAF